MRLILFTLILAISLTSKEIDHQKLDKILQLSDIEKLLINLESLHKSTLQDLNSTNYSPSTNKSIEIALIKSIPKNIFLNSTKKNMIDTLQKEDIEYLYNWYTSDFGKKVMSLDTGFIKPNTTIEEFQKSDPQRFALYLEFEKYSKNAHYFFTEHQIFALRNIATNELLLPNSKDIFIKTKKKLVSNWYKNYYINKIQDNILFLNINTFAPLTLTELQEYKSFLEHNSTQKLNNALLESYNESSFKILENYKKELKKAFSSKSF